MFTKFVRDQEDLEVLMSLLYRQNYREGEVKFDPPNLAIVTYNDTEGTFDLHEVSREEISKFNRYMDDLWR